MARKVAEYTQRARQRNKAVDQVPVSHGDWAERQCEELAMERPLAGVRLPELGNHLQDATVVARTPRHVVVRYRGWRPPHRHELIALTDSRLGQGKLCLGEQRLAPCGRFCAADVSCRGACCVDPYVHVVRYYLDHMIK